MHRLQGVSRGVRLGMALLVALVTVTVLPNQAAAQEQPDLTLTLSPPSQQSVSVGTDVSFQVQVRTQNGIGAPAAIYVTLPIGFTNVAPGDRSGGTCQELGPNPDIGGTTIRCTRTVSPGTTATLVVYAKAPTTSGTYRIRGTVWPQGVKDVNEVDNSTAVSLATVNVGVAPVPNPNAKGPNTVEVKRNPNVRK